MCLIPNNVDNKWYFFKCQKLKNTCSLNIVQSIYLFQKVILNLNKKCNLKYFLILYCKTRIRTYDSESKVDGIDDLIYLTDFRFRILMYVKWYAHERIVQYVNVNPRIR